MNNTETFKTEKDDMRQKKIMVGKLNLNPFMAKNKFGKQLLFSYRNIVFERIENIVDARVLSSYDYLGF